jgi:hypothetical protein
MNVSVKSLVSGLKTAKWFHRASIVLPFLDASTIQRAVLSILTRFADGEWALAVGCAEGIQMIVLSFVTTLSTSACGLSHQLGDQIRWIFHPYLSKIS